MIRKKCLSISIDFEDAHNLEKIATYYGQKISYIVGSEIKKFLKEVKDAHVMEKIDRADDIDKFGVLRPANRLQEDSESSTI
ncbi:MAG: hypothetical protein MUO77_18020 [Anaerolineales bacterium]|nr:hypothetical protein [Anaerolineales bacterium]